MIRKQQQIGNYLIERELGRGATSEVWLARHAHLTHRTVAIKVLLSQDQEMVQRFSMEAGLLSQLTHPNIIRIYDHGNTEHFAYSILEYIEGCSLQQHLQQHRRLSFPDTLHIFKHIAAALDYAHSLDIIHRDLSPGNILLEEPTNRALLTDFGIARDPNNNVTLDHRIMGTPGYWSPEHTRSARDVTHLSDLYSLGVLLYVMLCGDLPWDEIPGTHAAFGKPLSIKQRGPANLPNDIDRIIQTMLAVDPDKRYPNAQAAVDDLERIYQRHHATTRIESHTTTDNTSTAAPAAGTTNQTIQVTGIQENDVETILGPDLIRAPIAKAHQRARTLSAPDAIADILNTWSTHGFRRGTFRRPLLGRLAHLHQITSYNIYFYHLQVLYEQRNAPHTIEEPDTDGITPPLEPDTDRWHVPLPSIQEFTDHPGDQAILPGSTRVIACDTCKGNGKTPCPRCKGKRRVTITREVPPDPEDLTPPPPPARAARPTPKSPTGRGGSNAPNAARPSPPPPPQKPRTEQVTIPCPDCDGVGGTPCTRCKATGRLIQRKAFRWQRHTQTSQDHDDITIPNQEWLLKTCQPIEVYHERITGKPQSKEPALAPEWATIAGLFPLIEEATGQTSDTTRIILSELTIRMIPVTHISFDLGTHTKKGNPMLYHLDICGFENATPNEWSLLNWERVIFFWLNAFMLILVIIFGYFAFTL